MRRPAAFRRPAAAVAAAPSRHGGAAEWETLGLLPSGGGEVGGWATWLGLGKLDWNEGVLEGLKWYFWFKCEDFSTWIFILWGWWAALEILMAKEILNPKTLLNNGDKTTLNQCCGGSWIMARWAVLKAQNPGCFVFTWGYTTQLYRKLYREYLFNKIHYLPTQSIKAKI